MSKENFISIEFSQEELDRIDNLLSQLEEIIKGKFINLTPEERMKYARIGNKMEDWIHRVKQYMEQYPELVLPHINVNEFKKDFAARQALLPRLRRLQAITGTVDDTTLILGQDLSGVGSVFYRGIKIAAESNVPNAKFVYGDLKTQFPGRPSKKKDKDNNLPIA